LADCGINLSDAYRLFLTQVVRHGGLPFSVKVPNAETIEAMQEARELVGKSGENVYELMDGLEKEAPRQAR
jgi:DNA-damage-inducible protein J